MLGLLQALLDENADLTAPRLHRLPEGLTERVITRLGLLAEPAHDTLDLLAVLGRRVEFGELVALTGRPGSELGPILDSLVRTQLVTQDERGGELSYEITHPIVQEAIYQSMGATRRRTVHRRVGRSLLANGCLGEAAPHVARSAEPGDSDAIEALCRAVQQAEGLGAYREALIILGSLAEVLPANDDRWLGVLDGLVLEADWIFDHRSDAHGSVAVPALRAIDAMLGPSFDTARRAALKFRLGTFLIWGTGQLDEAQRVNDEARRLFEAAGNRAGALLARLEEASIDFARGNLAAWVEIGRAVADEAEAAGEPLVAMHAIGRGVGWSAVAHGAFDEADAAFRRAVTLARENGKPYFQSLSQLGLAYSLGLQGRIDEIEPLLADAKVVHPSWQEGSILEFEAVLRWVAGDFESTLRVRPGLDGLERQREEPAAWVRHGLRGDGGDGDVSPGGSRTLPGRGPHRLRGSTVGLLYRPRACRPGRLRLARPASAAVLASSRRRPPGCSRWGQCHGRPSPSATSVKLAWRVGARRPPPRP